MINFISLLSPLYVSIFWTFVLFLERKSSRPKMILSLVFFSACIQFMGNLLIFYKKVEIFNWFDSLYIFATLLAFPIFYIYLKLISNSSSISKNAYYHFIPAFVLSLVNLVLTFFMNNSDQIDYIQYYISTDYFYYNSNQSIVQFRSYFNMINRWFLGFQILFYVYLCNQLIFKYKELIQLYYSNYTKRKISWSNPFYFFIIISIAILSTNILGRELFFEYKLFDAYSSFSFFVNVVFNRLHW